MILPIVAYGDPVLWTKAEDITDPLSDSTRKLIEDMFETMYRAEGVGLAAPQIGRSIRLFVIDPAPFAKWPDLSEKEKQILLNGKQAFINPVILQETGEYRDFEEGCLSIPYINEKVRRKSKITIEYTDAEGNRKKENFSGLIARVIQHEYDHIEGILFTDRLSPLKKRLLKRKLEKIAKGEIDVPYPMKFPGKIRRP